MANPAEGYENYMVPTLFGPCARILIQVAQPKSGERVLDVGCGKACRHIRTWRELSGRSKDEGEMANGMSGPNRTSS